MFFLRVIGIIGAFDSNVLAGQVDVFACQYIAGADVDIFACFDVDVAADAAYGTAYLFDVLVVVLVFAFFFADGKAKTAANIN